MIRNLFETTMTWVKQFRRDTIWYDTIMTWYNDWLEWYNFDLSDTISTRYDLIWNDNDMIQLRYDMTRNLIETIMAWAIRYDMIRNLFETTMTWVIQFRRDTIWYDTIWRDIITIWFETIMTYDMIWNDIITIWFETIMTWYNYDMI